MNGWRDQWRQPEELRRHGNSGNKNSGNVEVKESVRKFFKELEADCEDYPSKIV